MEVCHRSSWLLLFLELSFIALQGVYGELDIQEGPSESECRPYIEKALKQLETGDTTLSSEDNGDEDIPTVDITDDSDRPIISDGENEDDDSKNNSNETTEVEEREEPNYEKDEKYHSNEEDDTENGTNDGNSEENIADRNIPDEELTIDQILIQEPDSDITDDVDTQRQPSNDAPIDDITEVLEDLVIDEPDLSKQIEDDNGSNVEIEDDASSKEYGTLIKEEPKHSEVLPEVENANDLEDASNESKSVENYNDINVEGLVNGQIITTEENDRLNNEDREGNETDSAEADVIEDNRKDDEDDSKEKIHTIQENHPRKLVHGNKDEISASTEESKEDELSPVEELIEDLEKNMLELRPTDHITKLLKLDENSVSNTKLADRMSEIILRDLKKLYETAIKPLEILYKYKDLSNRHYGDSEIFAKPLILFMGPWSGGKSTIINYLLGIDQSELALHTGAEPSPAYFNILMYGEEAEVLDGTQLAADYTFSGLQKFGQGLEERLRGYKLPRKLLQKVNIVEIPGILEVRKQVSRSFPFNDACQWFIDRADIIFLIYDPSKLDVGPETEAILDQLKGREQQTRIVLNKADQVKPEELMRVQGALIWNISPLMSSAQPPIMYTTSLWAKPYEEWAPVRLLQAQERAFLRDIHHAVEKRIDNKISSARRFAVRVRNHAKMVDCYLTTYYNHKSVFGNRKQVSDEIINHPQDFHIYEGLSTLTNISRYDLPDPDVYRDFFRLNALYDFQQLSATCTYFRGCPINRLDVAIAYDLPELVGKHKKLIENGINEANKLATPKS